jgi:ABC-type multidrug transport system fused ATPase/permease subunit
MKKESSMQKLFAYAGNYKYLTIASWILSAVSALIALLPFYDIWRIMQEVIRVKLNFARAQGIASYVGAWMECRGICTAFHDHLYLRTVVFPHCSLSRAGEYAKHTDASYSDAAHGIHGQ